MPAPTLTVVALLAVAVLAGCGGDDDDDGASAADLKKQLLPESQVPGFKLERSFEWDNPVDAVTQGLFLPEQTSASSAVDVYEDAGFEAGAGERLVVEKGNTFEGPSVSVFVAEFSDDDGASDALDFVHEEDLKQPCFAVCAVNPSELGVDGIPGAKGAQLLPLSKPPPNAPPPFEAYAVEFTVGPRLFAVSAGGGPKQVKKTLVLDAARRLYASNRGS